MASRNPKSELAVGVFEETFSTGILDTTKWKVTSGTLPIVSSNLPVLSPANANLNTGMLQLTLDQVMTSSLGSWNAATNSPALISSVGVKGTYRTVTTAGSTALDGVTGWTVGQVAIFDGTHWRKAASAPTFLSVGAEMVSKKRFGYGTYEMVVRASSIGTVPTEPGNAVSGSVSEVGTRFDAGSSGFIDIRVQNEGLWQRLDNFLVSSSNTVGTYTTKSSAAPAPDTAFYGIKFIWLPDRVEFYLNGTLKQTITANVPNITGQVRFSHYGTNGAALDFGGAISLLTRWMYVSYFRYTPSSTNVARNSSFEQTQANRPYYWWEFSISLPGDTSDPVFEWATAAGRTGGKALALKAITAVPYVVGVAPDYASRRWGFRTAPWEDPDHPYPSKEESRTGIRGQWQYGVWYVVSFYAKKGSGGASWTGMGLSWSKPPNQREDILNPTLTTSWQRYAFKFIWTNPVEPAGNMFVNVIGNTATNDVLHIDDIYVGLGQTVTTYEREAEDQNIPLTVTPPAAVSAKMRGTYFTAWDTSMSVMDVPIEYNTIFLFQAEPTGLPTRSNGYTDTRNGTFTYPYHPNTPDYEVQALRARGTRVILTLGGAGAQYFFLDRAASTRCFNSLKSIITTLGGVDGVDWNTYEQFSIAYPRLSGGAANPAWATMGTEMAWLSGQLRSLYGSNFSITTPAAPGAGYAPGDRVVVKAIYDAGYLTAVNPQYYDSPDLIAPATIKSLTDEWITLLGGDATKVGMSLGSNYFPTWATSPVGSSISQVNATIDLVQAAHPTFFGVAGWNTFEDRDHGYTFISNINARLT